VIELEGVRRREFRRLLLVSAIAHGVLLAAFMISPSGSVVAPRGVVSVELVGLPAAAAAPKAAPSRPKVKPTPAPQAPKPKPKPPVKPKVVLPEKPTTPEPAKPEEKPVEVAKAERPPEPKPPPEPARPAALEYDDVLDQLRSETGENRPPVEETAAAQARGTPGAGGSGRPVSAEVAAWLKAAKIHVRRNWVVPPGFRTEPLETHVMVRLDASGRVNGEPRVVKRSGNPWYDEGVVRAIQKSSPLPPPPEAAEWSFVFIPEDSY